MVVGVVPEVGILKGWEVEEKGKIAQQWVMFGIQKEAKGCKPRTKEWERGMQGTEGGRLIPPCPLS